MARADLSGYEIDANGDPVLYRPILGPDGTPYAGRVVGRKRLTGDLLRREIRAGRFIDQRYYGNRTTNPCCNDEGLRLRNCEDGTLVTDFSANPNIYVAGDVLEYDGTCYTISTADPIQAPVRTPDATYPSCAQCLTSAVDCRACRYEDGDGSTVRFCCYDDESTMLVNHSIIWNGQWANPDGNLEAIFDDAYAGFNDVTAVMQFSGFSAAPQMVWHLASLVPGITVPGFAETGWYFTSSSISDKSTEVTWEYGFSLVMDCVQTDQFTSFSLINSLRGWYNPSSVGTPPDETLGLGMWTLDANNATCNGDCNGGVWNDVPDACKNGFLTGDSESSGDPDYPEDTQVSGWVVLLQTACEEFFESSGGPGGCTEKEEGI